MPSISRTPILATGLQRRLTLFCATGAGAGYAPIIPGTIGTLVAVPLSIGFNQLADVSLAVAGLALGVAILSAVALAGKAAEILQQKDPGIIVIDEIVGFLLANFTAQLSFPKLLMTFLLFRFFDISKIFPASRVERLPGGTGIVADDLVAGLYTFAVMRLLSIWGFV